MTEHEKLQYINYMQMKEELDNVVYGGVELKLDGCSTSSHSIASICVFQEETDYMRDYRRNEEGRIAELNFDPVERYPYGKYGGDEYDGADGEFGE